MRKILLVIIGSLSVLLGILGIVLPILPTTPFLLLAAYCYMKSSKTLHNWLLNNKYLGFYIKNYYEKNGIPLKTKVVVIGLLWVSIGYSVLIILNTTLLQVLLLTIASFVTMHILKQNTLKTKA